LPTLGGPAVGIRRHSMSEGISYRANNLLTYLLAILSFSPLFLFFPHTVQGISVFQGDAALDFTATTIEGKSVSLSEFRGKIVFVAFWASWCSRCKEEMDYLKELKSEYPTVEFLAINAESEEPDEETMLAMQKAIEDWDVPFTVLIDHGLKIWDLYKINALPTSFIIGPDGTILFAEPNFYYASPKNINDAMHRIFNPEVEYSEREVPVK
jgi:thiol-disulfide isomerase/thioredoxin